MLNVALFCILYLLEDLYNVVRNQYFKKRKEIQSDSVVVFLCAEKIDPKHSSRLFFRRPASVQHTRITKIITDDEQT